MESNWRFNVWRYGLDPSFCTLFARRLGFPGTAISNVSFTRTLAALWRLPSAPGQLPTFLFYFPVSGIHFPYGQLVEPD